MRKARHMMCYGILGMVLGWIGNLKGILGIMEGGIGSRPGRFGMDHGVWDIESLSSKRGMVNSRCYVYCVWP
jgi:hypothetical protein